MGLSLLALAVMAGCSQGPSGSAKKPAAADQPPPNVAGFNVTFNVYSGASFTTRLWTLPMMGRAFRTTADYDAGDSRMPPSRTWRFQGRSPSRLENGWMDDGLPDFLDVAVTYSPVLHKPTFIKIIQTRSSSGGYRSDMFINGKMVVHNIENHRGEVFDVQSVAAEGKPGT
jgi:hypothetical protein